MLQKLPMEVLELVFAQIHDRRDLKSLCEVSKSLYDRAALYLYSSGEVTVRASGTHYLDEVEVDGLLRAAERPHGFLGRIVNLRISAPFVKRLMSCCMLSDYGSEDSSAGTDNETEESDIPSLRHIGERVLPVLRGLQDDKLRVFTWDMGMCVPPQLLGQGGYIPKHQKRIQHLRLLTDGNCALYSHGSVLALGELDCLKDISWVGIRTETDFAALCGTLRNNKEHLEALELDFIDWELVQSLWWDMDEDEDLFFTRVLRVRSTELRYPALAKLSLAGLDLTSYSREVAYAINTPCLRDIALCRCPGWELFLQHLLEANSQRHMQSVEIRQTLASQSMSDDEEQVLIAFIGSVNGLENLYLSLPSPMGTRALLRVAGQHTATLRRFVYHGRSICLDENSDFYEEEMDMQDMALLSCAFIAHLDGSGNSEDMDTADDACFSEKYPNPLAGLELECIGLACHPQRLKEVLQPFASKDCLQILHIRQSGVDIDKFGSWVFGRIRMDDDTMSEHHSAPGRQEFCYEDMMGWISRRSDAGKGPNVPVATILDECFREFADWAFGDDGIASLRILAYGDFSCGGRFAHNCFMMRRRSLPDKEESPYRFYFPESQRDPDLEGLLGQHAGFLEACPTSTIL